MTIYKAYFFYQNHDFELFLTCILKKYSISVSKAMDGKKPLAFP